MLPPPPHVVSTLWPLLLQFLIAVIRSIEAARVAPPVTSWYRDTLKNAAVGGHQFSQHRLGLAMDFATQSLTPEQVQALGFALEGHGLNVVEEGDHLHVQLLPAGAAQRAGLFSLVGVV